MTDHTFVEVPAAYQANYTSKYACWNCGLLTDDPSRGDPFGTGKDCEHYLRNCPGWCWGPGQSADPFASIRGSSVVTVPGTNSTQNPYGVGGAGGGGGCIPPGTVTTNTYGYSMPIRRDLNQDEREGNFSMKKSEPSVPGINDGFDKDAYDDFMRNL
jgi:hypothetical protein